MGRAKKQIKGRGGTCSSGLLTVTGQYGEVVRHEDGLGLGNPGDDTGNDDADEGLGSNKTDDKICEDGLRLGRGDDGQVGEGVRLEDGHVLDKLKVPSGVSGGKGGNESGGGVGY